MIVTIRFGHNISYYSTGLLLRSLFHEKLPDFGCTALYISQVVELVVLGCRQVLWLFAAFFKRSLLFETYYEKFIIYWITNFCSILLAIFQQDLSQGVLSSLPLNSTRREWCRRILVGWLLLIIVLAEATVPQHLFYLLRYWEIVVTIFDIEVRSQLQGQTNCGTTLANAGSTLASILVILARQHRLSLMIVRLLPWLESIFLCFYVVLGHKG